MMALKMAMVAVMVAGVMVAVMVAGVMAAPQGTESLSRAKLELPEEPQFPPQPYVFKFNINDEVGGVRFAEIEQMDGNGQVQGTYSYVRPDDVLVVVQYTADQDGFHPQIHEEPAPKFERNPSGTSKFSVSLPYAEEYSVEVTGAQLRQYHDQALQREQQSAQIRQNRESDDQIQEDGPLPQLSQEETTEQQQRDDQIQEDGPLPQPSQEETTEQQQNDN